MTSLKLEPVTPDSIVSNVRIAEAKPQTITDDPNQIAAITQTSVSVSVLVRSVSRVTMTTPATSQISKTSTIPSPGISWNISCWDSYQILRWMDTARPIQPKHARNVTKNGLAGFGSSFVTLLRASMCSQPNGRTLR